MSDDAGDMKRMGEKEFLQLVDLHQSSLFRFAYQMTGSVADAEDIVQECFLELLRPECSYDAARTPVRTYLFGVIRNQALKRIQRRTATPMGVDVCGGASPEGEALKGELEACVSRALAELPQEQREVLLLAHYEQLSITEIAFVVRSEVTTVKSRLQRARAYLREVLSDFAPCNQGGKL